jgi:hypothetical protein
MGDTILNDIWLETHSSPRSAFDAIEGFRNQDLSAWPASSCDHNRLFKKLVGFEFEPRYRSFMTRTLLAFEDGSRLTRELCFSPGLIFQTVIAVDPELANDLERLWPIHRFELLDRCANGCEMLVEVIEREMAADDRADDRADEDGLFDEDRRLIWGGVQFMLTTNQAMVFRLLVDAYPHEVLKSTIEEKLGDGELRDSFRRKDSQGKNRPDPCWGLIVPGSRKDSKRLIAPEEVASNPKKFSDPQDNPQCSPG